MKNLTVLVLLTIMFRFGCFAQGGEVLDFFTLTDMYCVNEEYKMNESIKGLLPGKAIIMWVSTDTLNMFSVFIPDSVDSRKDKVYALGKFELIDCDITKKEIIYEEDTPKICAKGNLSSTLFKGSTSRYFVIEKLNRKNPKDPYQYLCFTIYYKPVNGVWYMLQMFGKTLELKHKF